MQSKTKLVNSNQIWNAKKRYKINEVVTLNSNIYQNTTGINTNPILNQDWILLNLDEINWIKSNESLSLAQRKGDVLYGILDQYTGEEITLLKVAGTPTVDNVIFFQLGTEYFKRATANLIHVRWFGAVLDGITDDTSSLRNAFLTGVTYGYTIKVPANSTMLVSGAILNSDSLTSKNLNVVFGAGCKINVSGSSTNFEGLFYLSQASVFDINIQGNGVVINCNNKSSAGFYLRNNSLFTGGNCIIRDIEVINVYKGSSALLTLACQGVGVGGGFDRIEFNNVVVDTVSYSSLGVFGMEAKGIVAYETVGDVFFINCQVNRVTSETGQDADGYAVFSKRPTEASKTLGKAFFINCSGIDNQGRHIKSQNSTTYILGGVFSRKDVVTIAQGVDFDFQWGNGTVDNVSFIYEKSSLGVSPLGTSFVPIVFQNYTTDVQKISRVSNCSVQTELVLNNFCISLVEGKKTTVELDSNTLKSIKTLSNTSSCISRSFVEFSANQVESSGFEQLELVVTNNNINTSLPIVGYTGSSTLPDLYNKITLIADGNTAFSAGSGGRLFGRLSGGFIKKAKIISKNNTGINCIFADGWEVDTAELPANTNFSMFLDQTTLVNAPAGLGTTGFINIKTESESITGYIPKTITLDDGSKSYYTISGTWTRLVNQSDLDLKANDNSVVKITGFQEITGLKSVRPANNGTGFQVVPNAGSGPAFLADLVTNNTSYIGYDVTNNGTGLSYRGRNNGVTTFTVDRFGLVTLVGGTALNNAVPRSQLLYTNQTITANKTVTISEFVNNNELILSVNATSGNITITLPTFTALQGYKVTVKKMDSSANSVLITGVGGVNIDGAATLVISGQYGSATVGANLTQYIIL